MQLSQKDMQTVSTALRELYAHTDAATLPHCIVRLVHRLIPANSAVYNSFDFRTGEMQVVHDHGAEGDRYLPALQQRIQEHPLLAHVRAHWQAGAAALSDVITHRELRNTPIYCEFLHPLQIERQLGLLVEDRTYGITAVGLQRNGSDFSQRDKDILSFFQPHLIQAYKNASDLTALKQRVRDLDAATGLSATGVIGLRADEKIEWLSGWAAQWLREYFPGPQASPRLPPALAAWIRRQKTGRAGNHKTGWRSGQTVAGPNGRLQIRWVYEPPNRSCLILSEQRQAPAPQTLSQLGLSSREAEVLHWVAQGKTNEVVARVLGVSKRTVEKHMERILAKLGVESRVDAVLRAWEAPPGRP